MADDGCQIDLLRSLIQKVDDLPGLGLCLGGAVDDDAVGSGVGHNAGGADACGLRRILLGYLGEFVGGIRDGSRLGLGCCGS